jgi:enoyl-CoA hydratase/carnithine racemase
MTDAQRQFEIIRVEQRGRVGLIVLDRPQALNALSGLLATELLAALDELEGDNGVGCIVVLVPGVFASTMTDGLVAVAETRARQYSVHPVTIHSILAGWTERHVQAAE